jgi:LacI family transcriptional regulator
VNVAAVVGWDQAEVGRIAVGMLLDRIRNGGSPEACSVLVLTEFILRASVGPPKRHA